MAIGGYDDNEEPRRRYDDDRRLRCRRRKINTFARWLNWAHTTTEPTLNKAYLPLYVTAARFEELRKNTTNRASYANEAFAPSYHTVTSR